MSLSQSPVSTPVSVSASWARPVFPYSAVVARLRAAGCVFAEDEARLLTDAARTAAELVELLERRVSGQPLEHVVGWARFCDLRIAVESGVFVPRRRTELMVAHAVDLVRRGGERPRPVVVVDLCCGSGAVGAALSVALGGVELHAADLDPAAVRCAHRNLDSIGGHVYQGDLVEPLPAALRGRVNILTANAPYVPTGQIGLLPAEAREYEPHLALDGGADGLAIVRRVIAAAPRWLASGGHLLIETSEGQAAQIRAVAASAGLLARIEQDEELDATILVATKAGPAVP